MRYFQFVEPNWGAPTEISDSVIIIVFDYWIKSIYYPYWLNKMIDRWGIKHVIENYTFEDCINDWVVVHWAIEIKK